MPAAATKADLIAVTLKEYDKLFRLIAEMPEAQALKPREEGISIKDVIGHRAHWITLFLGWHADGQAGREVYFPAPGYKWNDLKVYNTQLRADQAGLGWDEVRGMLARNHATLLQFMEDHDDAHLYGGPMEGGHNDWTPGRWAEAAGPSHYRSAAKFIRACLREDG